MNDQRSSPSVDYIECARRLRKLHELIRAGECDSDRAEELRDEMDEHWRRMTDEERDWSGDLSADLHVLGEDRPLFGDRTADPAIRQQLLEARHREDWSRFRVLLDADADSADLFHRILFRAIYWAALRDHESSLAFLESLAKRVKEDRSRFDLIQPVLNRLARIGNAAAEIAIVQHLGHLALERMAHVSEKLDRLILDAPSLGSTEVATAADPVSWDVANEWFLQAEELLLAFLEVA